MEEEWKPIEDYTDYSVSNLGNVRNDKTKKILKPANNGKGSLKITLPNNSQRYIHRLMCLAFLPNPNNYPVIDHIDRNPSNNILSNLRWCSQSNNIRNYSKAKNKSSQYKGVGFHKSNNKFRAFITFNNKMTTIGYFETELEGAKAYNDFIVAHNLGEFTPLNII